MKLYMACLVTETNSVIVLASQRSQVFQPDAFTGLGLDPVLFRLVMVKSTQHFRAGLASMASAVHHVSTPGAIAYETRSLDYWPRVDDPLRLNR